MQRFFGVARNIQSYLPLVLSSQLYLFPTFLRSAHALRSTATTDLDQLLFPCVFWIPPSLTRVLSPSVHLCPLSPSRIPFFIPAHSQSVSGVVGNAGLNNGMEPAYRSSPISPTVAPRPTLPVDSGLESVQPTSLIPATVEPPPDLPLDYDRESAQPSSPIPPIFAAPSQTPNEASTYASGADFRLLQNISPCDQELFFGSNITEKERENGKEVARMLLDWTKQPPYNDIFDNIGPEEKLLGDALSGGLKGEDLLMMEKRARAAFDMYKDQFPTTMWHCCKRQCFSNIAIDPQKLPLLRELRAIHTVAEEIHADIVRASAKPDSAEAEPETRRKGVGGSNVAFVAPGREEREREEGIVSGTDRKRALVRLAKFVLEVLPFLYGQEDANGVSSSPAEKLCTKAICNLLGVSHNFLYLRRKRNPSDDPTEQELVSLVDMAGGRLRQHRRMGDRAGYPPIPDLPSFDCGCPEPCLAGLKTTYLKNEYKAFSSCAGGWNPRRKENQYLLNVMFAPFTNSPVKYCDNALSALYTVSPQYIGNVRFSLQQMCDDDSVDHREFLKNGLPGYNMSNRHPIYKYGAHIREKVEKHLDFVLRADPAGADGHAVCRVYSPEINTKEKLRDSIAKALDEDKGVAENLSESTLQRMVDTYLKERKCTVSFSQNDHNACPTCKTLRYASLQYSHDVKRLKRRYAAEFEDLPEPVDHDTTRNREELNALISTKSHQENQSVEDIETHLGRDAKIRQTLKIWSDHFRGTERAYLRRWKTGEYERPGTWNSLPDHAIITHQDDMTKVDLPHFLQTVSGDITRWRYDVNAHVSSVNDDCVVFSHEQGTGSKNASSVCEMVILDHLIRCKGEGIKVVVSDNASVGKNWITTVVLPQYFVDQGLADIVFIVFLENNHGKWLADMLFGQMQTRRRRTTLLSVDDMLNEFESVRRRSGRVQGFAVNPLSSVTLTAVFESLGYRTKPPKKFGFIKRNIHFAAACRQTAKDELSPELKELFGSGLPNEEGMVRMSSSPPTTKTQTELPYEERYFDVPAAMGQVEQDEDNDGGEGDQEGERIETVPTYFDGIPPLVVPLDKEFKESGHGVVAQRTAQHVGYNGIGFRKFKGYPELKDTSSKLARQAWPIGLVKRLQNRTISEEPVYGVESRKSAPENWVVRRTVSHFGKSELEWKARYPPRNVLNAVFGKGPRVAEPWIPTQTYTEPPFPIIEGMAASSAMRMIEGQFDNISKSIHVLDILRAVFECMGGREDASDPWLQRRATVPSMEALMVYRNDLQTFIERCHGEPSQVKTVRQFFKEDPEVKNKVEVLLRAQGAGARPKGMKTKMFAKLFEEASNTPGGLDKYVHMMEKDLERFAAEQRVFKEKQRKFDEQRGLLPQESQH